MKANMLLTFVAWCQNEYANADGSDTGEIWEGYVRDKKHLSRPPTPFYKGIPRDYGRDEPFFAVNFKNVLLLQRPCSKEQGTFYLTNTGF